jgi:hypothetical protein
MQWQAAGTTSCHFRPASIPSSHSKEARRRRLSYPLIAQASMVIFPTADSTTSGLV